MTMEDLLKYLVYAVAALVALASLLGMVILLKRRKATGSTPQDSGDSGWFAEYKQYLWSFLLVIVGGGFAIWGFVTQVRPADVGSLGWQYWFPLLVIWGTLAALIALDKEALGTAGKALQTILAVGMAVVLVVLPIWSWWVTPSPTPQQAQQPTRVEVPLASSPQSEWPKLAIPVDKSEFIQRPPGMKVRIAGYDFVPYVTYVDGSECPGRERQCPEGSTGVRVQNEALGKNIVAYAFVPD